MININYHPLSFDELERILFMECADTHKSLMVVKAYMQEELDYISWQHDKDCDRMRDIGYSAGYDDGIRQTR